VVLCVAIVGREPTTGKRQTSASAHSRHKHWAVSGKREKVRREKEEAAMGKRARPLP
jgi:hypothetical protein